MAKNQDEDVIVDETEDTGADLRVYELGFHIDPELPVEEVKKVHQAIHTLISSSGAIVAEVEPQKIQLAYTISRQDVAGRRDFSSAYFAWVVYEMTAANHAEVITAVGSNKFVIRFIDLVTTKDEARHALEVHELLAKVPEAESSEDVLGTELDAALEKSAV
ncbi:MAG: 30S ribosomal protein S6 [Candidatus Paceibacterota bacterium]